MTDTRTSDQSAPHSAVPLSDQFAATVETASRAVVAVHGRGRRPSSGLIWEPGIVVTAEETVERDSELAVTLPDGRRVETTLAGRDPSTDIAVLRYSADAATAPVFESLPSTTALRPGHFALAVGRYDGDVIAALGIVSLAGAAWRSRHGGTIDARLRIDVRLPRAVEGGALVAADGALIGMPVFGPRHSVLAIPAATIARTVEVIKASGHVARGYLGVGLQPVPVSIGDSAAPRRAAMVATLDPAGPAHAAGLLQGDIIVALGGEAVTGVRGLYQRLGPDTVGTTVGVELIRAGIRTTMDVTIAARPRA